MAPELNVSFVWLFLIGKVAVTVHQLESMSTLAVLIYKKKY